MKRLCLVLFVLLVGYQFLFSAIYFDGSPGTAAPPSTLGGYPMTAFGSDGRAFYADYSFVPSPLGGNISFSSAVQHRGVPNDGFNNWSHGYTGDVYGAYSQPLTIYLPSGTTAFYLYMEADVFGTFTLSATANDGTTSGGISVNSPNGAQYYGFYVTGGSSLTSISLTSNAPLWTPWYFFFGEFGICNGPTQDHDIVFSNVRPNQFNVSWTRENGDGSFLVVKAGSALTGSDYPVNLTTYSSYNTNYSSAPSLGSAKICYIGTGNSILLTGLATLQRYYMKSFAYFGSPSAGTEYFNLLDATGNPASQRTSRYKESFPGDESVSFTSFDIENIYPLPASENVSFELSVFADNVIKVEIFDVTGRLIYSANEKHGIGKYSYTIPVNNLINGTYILKLSGDNDIIVNPFVINR